MQILYYFLNIPILSVFYSFSEFMQITQITLEIDRLYFYCIIPSLIALSPHINTHILYQTILYMCPLNFFHFSQILQLNHSILNYPKYSLDHFELTNLQLFLSVSMHPIF